MLPFFSIVLPSKNRGDIIGFAIQSVLNQTYEDFELIVVDNDDSDRTQQVVTSYSDPRIRYIRTGGLPMADNWNAGFIQSRGEYTLVMGDKYVFVHNALERLHALVRQERHPVVYWNLGSYVQYRDIGYLRVSSTQGAIIRSDPHQILHEFTHAWKPNTLSIHAYNTMTHRSILDQMINSGTKRPCMRVAPDYSIIYQQLSYADYILGFDATLSLASNAERGNGFRFVAKSDPKAVEEFVTLSGGLETFSSHVPIKTSSIECSFLANDYLRIRDLVGGRLNAYDMDMANYFRVCMLEMVKRETYFGADMQQEWVQWEEALRAQPSEVQQSIANLEELLLRERFRWIAFRVTRPVALRLRYIQHKWRGDYFENPLEAAQVAAGNSG